jgi:N,N'-diacetyllegionaminate synthase
MEETKKKVIIIAEAGVNHNGDLNLAKRLIDVAAHAGADYVKFQTFKAERLVTKSAQLASYQLENTKGKESSQFSMLKRLELSRENHLELMDYCQEKGIRFLSTPFDIESAYELVELGLSLFKIPSGEITNFPFLDAIGKFKRDVILSTGMSSLGEIESALSVLEKAGTERKQISVLHCNTQYPTPFEDVNLKAMQTIKNALKVNVGYSDHTEGIEIPIAAVAMGATIIEKHFTLDKSMEGPDHKASLNPEELVQMVKSIKKIELALGDGIKRPTASEIANKQVIRKSLFVSKPIFAGEVLTFENLTSKRPGDGISPSLIEIVVGRTAKINLEVDHKLNFEDLEG